MFGSKSANTGKIIFLNIQYGYQKAQNFMLIYFEWKFFQLSTFNSAFLIPIMLFVKIYFFNILALFCKL